VLHDNALRSLVHQLVAATHVDDAATAALTAMFASTDDALAAGPYAGCAQLLRGVVHVRPHDSYQRLCGSRTHAARAWREPAI
jgi:hypothetical protein